MTVDKAHITASFIVRDGRIEEVATPLHVDLTAPIYHLTSGELLDVEHRGVLVAVYAETNEHAHEWSEWFTVGFGYGARTIRTCQCGATEDDEAENRRRFATRGNESKNRAPR